MGGVVAQSLPAALRREDPRQEAEKASPPGWYIPRAAVYKPARPTRPPPPCGHKRSANPPPKLKPKAKTWDGVRDGSPNSRVRRARPRVLSKRLRIHRHSSVSKLCATAWAYDLQVQTCRYFFTGVIRPVSLYLWGPMCGGRDGLRGEVKSLQFIMHSGIYHGHG